MRALPIISILCFVGASLQAGDVQLTVEDSGLKEVDALVLRLISDRPAPFPSGYWGQAIDMMPVPYVTLQVSDAMARLKQMGPPMFPALVKHLRDDRYSFSSISAAWDNLTVGDAVIEILSDGHYMYSGYKGRQTPSGFAVYLSFDAYLKDKGAEKWAEWAKDKTRLQIQMDFIDWCVVKEKARGFTDADQEKSLLARYQQARERVRKEYSEPDGAANGSQPIRSETNSTSSAAGSRR